MHLPFSTLAVPKYETRGNAIVTYGVAMLTADAPGQQGALLLLCGAHWSSMPTRSPVGPAARPSKSSRFTR